MQDNIGGREKEGEDREIREGEREEKRGNKGDLVKYYSEIVVPSYNY